MEAIEKLVFEVKKYKDFPQGFLPIFSYLPFPLDLPFPPQNLTVLPSFPKEAHGSQELVILQLGALYSD